LYQSIKRKLNRVYIEHLLTNYYLVVQYGECCFRNGMFLGCWAKVLADKWCILYTGKL